MVGNGIADAFAGAKINVLTIMQNMANGVIGIINELLTMLNQIPGVAIDPFEQLTFAASTAAEEAAKKQARDAALEESKAVLAAEKAAQQAKRQADRAADQAALDAQAAEDAQKQASLDQSGTEGFDYSQFGGDGSLGDIDKVGSVGRIEDDVTISEEDIKMLKDIASMDYQLHYTQLTPMARFGDTYISQEADADAILEKIEGFVEESLQSSLVVNS
jgi:multidrug efflux pump subunit AcrA (membrane-fusion protein)